MKRHTRRKRQTKDKAMNNMTKADRISHRVNIASAIGIGVTLSLSLPLLLILPPSDNLPPSLVSDNDDVALIHDPSNNTFIVYPESLPPCDEEDGTATVNEQPVAACEWNDGTGRSFIVIAP